MVTGKRGQIRVSSFAALHTAKPSSFGMVPNVIHMLPALAERPLSTAQDHDEDSPQYEPKVGWVIKTWSSTLAIMPFNFNWAIDHIC
jgi:hypothetical protein